MSQVWQPKRLTRQQQEERRLFAEPLIKQGQLTSTQIGALCGVSGSAVRNWRQRLLAQGSLEATVAPGPSRHLTDEQIAQTIDLLRAGSGPARYADHRWTCPGVRQLIGLKFDVWYDVDHLSRVLHEWGFSLQKPVKRAVEQDQEAVVTWIETKVPALEKKIEDGERLAFLDEVGFSLKPTVTRTWATRGQTPVLASKTNWERVSTIGAIVTTGQFLQQTHPTSIKGQQVISFLKHLLHHVQGKVTVILDNAIIHKTKALCAFVLGEERLSLEYLPPYSPELNPIEFAWAYVKRHVLANFCPTNVTSLKSRLTFAWQHIRYIQLPHRLLLGDTSS